MLRLTERLNQLTVNSQDTQTANEVHKLNVQSAANYVRKLLNIRQGSVAISPMMGMPYIHQFIADNGAAGHQALIEQIHRFLCKSINYIEHVDVRLLPNEQRSSIFKGVLKLSFVGQKLPVCLLISLQADSTYEVSIYE